MILFLPFFPPHADTSNSSPSHFKVIHYFPPSLICGGFPDGSVGKESTCSAGDTGDMGSIPGLGRSPGGRNDNPLQYSCLGNPLDRGAWQATVHGVAKSQIRLSTGTPLDLNLGEFMRFVQKNRLRAPSKRESWKLREEKAWLKEVSGEEDERE